MKVGDMVKPAGTFSGWKHHFGIIVEDAGHRRSRDPRVKTYRVQWFQSDKPAATTWWDDFQLEVVREPEA